MKQEESEILKGIGKNPGFKVPDNYFEDFNKRMAAALPEVERRPANVVPSTWVKIRPYFYMAATVAGIWCMLTVFNNLNDTTMNQINEVAEQMGNGNNADEFIMSGTSDYDLLNYEDSVAMDAETPQLQSVTNNE